MIKGQLTTRFGVRLKKVSMLIYDDIIDLRGDLKLVVSCMFPRTILRI